MHYDHFITGVNGTRVYDLDSFLDAVKQAPDEVDFTIQSEDWNGKEYNDILRKTSRAVSLRCMLCPSAEISL